MEKFSYKPESNFLKAENQQEDVREASFNLANYLKEENVSNIMFLDNSARQAYVGLKEAWKKVGEDKPEPNIYFINPAAIRDDGDYEYYAEEFKRNYKNLNPEEAIVLYDACIHTGAAIFSTKEFLEYLGFKDVRLAVTSTNEVFPEEKNSELDLICLDHRAHAGCRPFGRSFYVEGDSDKIISHRVDSKMWHNKGKEEHQKIKDIFKE